MARPETLFGGMLEFACSSTNAHHSRAGSTAEKRALALCGILTKRHDSADCCDSANKAFYDCESANKALCQNCSKVIIIIIIGGGGDCFSWVAAAALGPPPRRNQFISLQCANRNLLNCATNLLADCSADLLLMYLCSLTHACQCSFCRTNHAGANKHAYVCGDIHIYVPSLFCFNPGLEHCSLRWHLKYTNGEQS